MSDIQMKKKPKFALDGKWIKRIIAIAVAVIGLVCTVYTGVLFARSDDTELSVVMAEENYIVYDTEAEDDFGYRYGPSVISGEDGTYEALFSTVPTRYWGEQYGVTGSVMDVLTYRKSEDGGKTWSDEVLSLTPTQGSLDRCSVCDPSWIKVDGWYYVTYTSTFDITASGVYNQIYAARTKTPTDFRSWQKWNGSGWSDYGATDCEPILCYYGNSRYYGVGEPSMVYAKGKLYIYYTYVGTLPNGVYGNQSRLAIGEMTENWPATLKDQGPVLKARDGSEDSIDVKYVEELDMFLSLNTFSRFSRMSRLKFMASDDGLLFKELEVDCKDSFPRLHNAGLAGDEHGHIRGENDWWLMYAYQPEYRNAVADTWGHWNTARQAFTISERDYYNMHKPFEKSPKDDAISSKTKIWSLTNVREDEGNEEVGDRFDAVMAADDDPDTYFFSRTHSSATYNEVLALRIGKKAKKVGGIELTPNIDGEGFPVRFKFQYSSDGYNWTDVPDAVYDYSQNPVRSSDPIAYKFTSSVKAKFVRLVTLELSSYDLGGGGGLYYLQIAEMRKL